MEYGALRAPKYPAVLVLGAAPLSYPSNLEASLMDLTGR